ncbi:MAG: hypothetical protein K8F91_21490, partial [Candidatus Obscuribacterales bacterium]|nr:hypothetical protein [Candidatus Obscuribacterales bacterium]
MFLKKINAKSNAIRRISRLLTTLLLLLSVCAPYVHARPFTPSAERKKDPAYYPAYYPQESLSEVKKVAAGKDKVILKGHLNYCVPKGTPIKLKLSMVPSTGLRLMDRDLEGNLHPARVDQKITAKTTEDIYVD